MTLKLWKAVWSDWHWRINILFASLFLTVALLLVGLNVYKHVRYSTLIFAVKGQHYRVMSGDRAVSAEYDSTSGTTRFILHTSWWETTTYALAHDGKPEWSFVAYPTLRGNVRITNPPHSGHVAYALFDIHTLAGTPVEYVQPRHWYEENALIFEYKWPK